MSRALHRPDKELFGSNQRALKKILKCLKNLTLRCSETRHATAPRQKTANSAVPGAFIIRASQREFTLSRVRPQAPLYLGIKPGKWVIK
jgi:hypothetical protein